MHKMKKTLKTIEKLVKAFKKYAKTRTKARNTLRADIAKSFAVFIGVVTFIGCGSTKVSVSKPSEGTCTTITVTTNNPIQTNINPTITGNVKP